MIQQSSHYFLQSELCLMQQEIKQTKLLQKRQHSPTSMNNPTTDFYTSSSTL